MEVKEFPLVGRAAVAARNFEINEVVMIEHPLMVLPKLRQSTPLFDKLDELADKNRLQIGLLYPAIYYNKASAEIKEKVHEFYAPKLEPGTVQYQRYFGAANEMVKMPEFENLTPDAIVNFLLILRINVHMIGDGTKMSALFYMGSKGLSDLMTHSCDPNCMALALGTKLSYRAIKPIYKGDLITFSYISGFDLWKSTAARRALIRDTRFFTCVCSRCVGPDYTRMMKCPKCGGQRLLYFMTGQEGFLGKDPRPPTETPWTCQNAECKAQFRDSEMPLEMEAKFHATVLDTYFSGSQNDKPSMLEACDQELGANHYLSAMMVYTLMAVHHTALNRQQKPFSTGREVVMWGDRLARWMQLTMPGSMPQAVIAKFVGQTCEVYGVNKLAAEYYSQCVPLLRVHYGERHKQILEMEEFVKTHGNAQLVAALDPRTFSETISGPIVPPPTDAPSLTFVDATKDGNNSGGGGGSQSDSNKENQKAATEPSKEKEEEEEKGKGKSTKGGNGNANRKQNRSKGRAN